jgi:hypothetical protein
MWNPFKKISSNDPNQLGFIQRIAMKKLEKMSSKEKEKMMQEAMRPENIAKNKDKILAAMEQMKASGQITEEQIKIAKNKFGL